MSIEDNYDATVAKVEQALSEIDAGGFPTAWVLVAAVAHEDGDDRLYTINSPSLPFWQKHGLLSQGAASSAGQPEWTYDEEDDA